MRGSAHRAVLTRGEDGRRRTFLRRHVLRRPARQLKFRMTRSVARGNTIVVLGERGPVLGHEHGAERLIARLEGLGRQLDTTLKVPKVGVGRRHGDARSEAIVASRYAPGIAASRYVDVPVSPGAYSTLAPASRYARSRMIVSSRSPSPLQVVLGTGRQNHPALRGRVGSRAHALNRGLERVDRTVPRVVVLD